MSKTDSQISLCSSDGTFIQHLPGSVRTLLVNAELRSTTEDLSGNEAIDRELSHLLDSVGASVPARERNAAVKKLNEMRASIAYTEIVLKITGNTKLRDQQSQRRSDSNEEVSELLEEFTFPNPSMLARYDRLGGIDDHKDSMLTALRFALRPEDTLTWSKRHHSCTTSPLMTAFRERVPLIILQGDVGTGKTVLAETIAAALIRIGFCQSARLLKINGQIRGTGLVGQMTTEIIKGFTAAKARAIEIGAGVPILLLLDEADSIASSRAGEQMHHEDRAGVNALLQALDSFKSEIIRPVVIFATNRLSELDPAIKRRSMLTLKFERPNLEAREAIFRTMLNGYGFEASEITDIARVAERRPLPFTASDITDRILPMAVQHCVTSDCKLTVEVIADAMTCVEPSSAF